MISLKRNDVSIYDRGFIPLRQWQMGRDGHRFASDEECQRDFGVTRAAWMDAWMAPKKGKKP